MILDPALIAWFQAFADADANLQGNFIGLAPEEAVHGTRGSGAVGYPRLTLEFAEGSFREDGDNGQDVAQIAFTVETKADRQMDWADYATQYALTRRIAQRILHAMRAQNWTEWCSGTVNYLPMDLNQWRYYRLKGRYEGVIGWWYEGPLIAYFDASDTTP